MKKIKVGSDFSGVGAFNQALKRLGVEFEEVFACDMDKYARQTFIHNYGEPKYFPTNVYEREIPNESLDIYMTSPPCQAFSLAGKRLGKDDSRGILFFNSLEFIQKNNPRYFIFENVKGLLSDDNGKTFQEWINYLGGKSVNGSPVIFPYEESVPYHLYWKVLNAKEHGVPQNRERVFLIGIRDDKDNNFRFPIEEHLSKRLKDVLENDVDDKYFLSQERVNTMTKSERSIGFTDVHSKNTANCLLAAYSKITTDGEYIKITSANSKGYEKAKEGDSINLAVPNSETRRERVGKGVAQTLDTGCQQGVIIPLFQWGKGSRDGRWVYDKNGISPCMVTAMGSGGGVTPSIITEQDFSIGDYRSDEGFRWRKDGNSPVIMAMMRDTWDEKFTGKNPPIIKYGDKRLNETLQKNNLPDNKPMIIDTYNKSIHEECPTLKKHHAENGDRKLWDGFKIRRLTPRECFRLMDFPDTFTWPVSDSQAYKQAGNSIVVNVLYKIIKNLNL